MRQVPDSARSKYERVTIADNPNFDVYINGTLVIKRVLPVDNAGENVYSLRPEELYRDKRVHHDPQCSQR